MVEKVVSEQELIALLTGDNYFLMIDDESNTEHYDEQGNLVVCTDSGEKWMAVPNIEVIRKLYNLPINEEKKDDIIKTEISNHRPICEDECDSPMVWIGQRTQKCQEATKALIKLVDCPKYQKLMNNKNTIKVKVWEKIASELQEQGFKIANTVKEAGEKTFQKWRNMERTYWKYLRNPDEFGEDKRKKKPSFFDDMHVVLSRQSKALRRNDSNCSSEVDATEEDCDIADALPIDAFRRSQSEPLSRDVVQMLVKLVTFKYQQVLNNSDSSKQMKIWESIYEEITEAGLKVAETKRAGAIKLGLKWKSLERRRYLNRRNKKPIRNIYNPKLRKSLLIEMTKAKATKIEEPINFDDLINSEERQLKDGEIAPKAVEALLTLINSEKYQELFNGGGKKARVWDKIYDEIESMGFEIPGETKRDKIQRLFQKWRNMKRTFIKYQIEKDIGRSRKKPQCYDLLLKIISKDIFRDSEDVVDMAMHLGHESNNSHVKFECSAEQVDMAAKSNASADPAPLVKAPTSTNQSSADITDILLQIKTLHENALAVQQENLSKVVCLLEEQVREQKTLNSLFTQYVVNYSNKKNRSKSSSKSSPSNGFNEDHLNKSLWTLPCE